MSVNSTVVNDDAPEGPFQTLTERVYLTLRREILAGETPPGTRLVRRALGARLGVSPLPIMEALHRLERDGLVESEPMYGHRVRLMTAEAVANDHVLREALECQAARLCAERAGADDLKRLARLAAELDALHESAPASAEHAEKHLEFHLAIARATGYGGLAAALEKLWFRRLMLLNTHTAAVRGLPRHWHQQLVEALTSRDADRAESAMRRHVRFNVDQQIEQLRQRPPGAPSTPRARKGRRA